MNSCAKPRWGGIIKVAVHDWGPWEEIPIEMDAAMKWRKCKLCSKEELREIHEISEVDPKGAADSIGSN